MAVVAMLMMASGLLTGPAAHADPADKDAATATLQDIEDSSRAFVVQWRGRSVSALPVRLRLLNQASPLAYSLDIRRQPSIGAAWTAISLGDPKDPVSRSLPQIGVFNPLLAELIARGGANTGQDPVPAESRMEQAARQVAIWSITNKLPLTPAAVPDPKVRQRAQQWVALTRRPAQVPLQPADHSVQIFVRETTATTVRLAVTLNVDPQHDLERWAED